VSPSGSQTSVSPAALLPSSTTSSATQTPESIYTPMPPVEVLRVNGSCPSSGRLIVTFMGKDSEFACSAQTDLPGNDIAGLVAYTLQQCLESCILTNVVQGNDVCVAVAHSEYLRQMYLQYEGNCFLKSSKAGKIAQPDWTFATLV
jgi:hypothetical protein